MTPYLFKGVTMLKALNKTWDAVGSVGGLVSETMSACGESANILKTKVESSVEEEKIEQAKNRILVKAAAIREIAEALNCSLQDAEECLERELNN